MCGVNTFSCEFSADMFLCPSGSKPFLTPTGKPFEAGTRGFWRDYPNLDALVDELGLVAPFTPPTESAFYSPDGLEATAPVFGSSPIQLPSPLGQVFASLDRFKLLPLSDRATMAGLLLATLDFGALSPIFFLVFIVPLNLALVLTHTLCRPDRDEATLAAYDRMTAHELCVRFGCACPPSKSRHLFRISF